MSQGNHRIVPGKYGRRAQLRESTKGHAAWRELVTVTARIAMAQGKLARFEGPVDLHLWFLLPRPPSHLRKDGTVRKGYAKAATSKPDLSKLIRAVEDSLTDAGVWDDDSQVIQMFARKRYTEATLEQPGVIVEVTAL